MKTDSLRPSRHHQVIIIGAGPGGLQLAYFLGRMGVDYVVLDRASGPGSFFEKFPVHRRLLSINKVNTGTEDAQKNLRWDWNSLLSEQQHEIQFKQFDQAFFPHADSLVRYLREFCAHFKIRTCFDCDVCGVSKRDGKFLLNTTHEGEWTCHSLVVATGTSIPYTPRFPGSELAEPYDAHDRSVESCRNKDFLTLGKGNSAFETAEALLPYAAHIHLLSPAKLRMAWQTHFPGHVRQINSPFWETFPLKQQNAVLNGNVHSIERRGPKLAVSVAWSENDHRVTLQYDRVIACTGFQFDSAPFAQDVKPSLTSDGKLPMLNCHWESVNVPGLYFCGSLMQSNDYKKSASAFVHGMRYNARVLGDILTQQLSGRTLPRASLPLEPAALLDAIYERISRLSSLWHMNDSLCDAYILDGSADRCWHFEDVPVRIMAEDMRYRSTTRIEFRFTFRNPEDPVEREKFTNFGLLHPVLMMFRKGKLIEESHVYEDVYAEWARDEFGFAIERALQRYTTSMKGASPGAII